MNKARQLRFLFPSLYIYIFIALFANGCKSTGSSDVSGIIGEKNWKVSNSHTHSNKVGAFISAGSKKDSIGCVGFLVGENLVATAVHCVQDPIAFAGATFRTKSGKKANIVELMEIDSAKDFVIYELDERYKQYFEIAEAKINEKIEIVSFNPEDESFISSQCYIADNIKESAAFSYKCDTLASFSGSPILQEGRVVGMHIGYSKKNNLNYGLNITNYTPGTKNISQLAPDFVQECWAGSNASPFCVTPEELGEYFSGGRLSLPLETHLNGEWYGDPDAGPEMHFSFYDLIEHITKTRSFTAGTILGSGTVSNRDRSKGSSCLAEKRMIQKIDEGAIRTPFMSKGDVVRIEMKDPSGLSIFGTINQTVV